MGKHSYFKRITMGVVLYVLCSMLYGAPAQAQIVPTPGGSCELLKDDAQRKECRKAICPQGSGPTTCTQGKCVPDGQTPTAEMKAILLPCNYTLEDLISAAVRVALFIVGITGSLTLLFFAYGGYSFFTSMGNPEAIQKAKGILTAAFIGFMLIVGSGFLIQFVAKLVLPDGKIGRELLIDVGTACNDPVTDCGGDHYACVNKTCISQCQDQKGPQGYFCRPLVCDKDKPEDCNVNGGTDYTCYDGGCVTTKERAEWGPEKLECIKDICPGGNYNQCCRLKPAS